ncbi:hypothetical protein [Chthoniobacter flavus]|nr:hypothetical protein [Chthoniobacter flavus]
MRQSPPHSMDLPEFLIQLGENGLAVVSDQETIGGAVEEIVRGWDAVQRQNLPGTAPDLVPAAATWAAIRLYRGCQALVCREIPPAEMAAFLREPCPCPESPAVDYSVDLVFRFLPDLLAIARRVSTDDPLVTELLALARAWPLSSVGMEGVGTVNAARLLRDPCLRQLYIDRILLSGDTARLNDDAVRAAAKAALGAYPELAPEIATALQTTP